MALVLVPAFCLLSDDLCQPSLGRRMQPGPSLTCSVVAKCPHRPSWYDRDGARQSPGQTSGGAGATELRISPSQLDPEHGADRCQVDRYRDECDSDQSQPLGTIASNMPRVEVSWPAGKAPLREGDGFTLHCQAAALRPVAGYVWSRGDVWLPGAGQDLRVEKAAVSDEGSYTCGVWVSGPGWGYLSLSARESVEVQRYGRSQCLSPSLMASVVVAILLLVVLLNVGACYLLGRGRRQVGAVINIKGRVNSFKIPPCQRKNPFTCAEFSHRRSHAMRNSKDRPRIFTASWSIPKLVPTELCRNPDQPENPLHGCTKRSHRSMGAGPSGVHKRRLSIVPGGARALALPQAPSPLHPFPQGHTPALLPPHLFPPPSALHPRSSPLCLCGQEERGRRGKH
ncbi:unnamed protein product [Eretmochelys imbricata]